MPAGPPPAANDDFLDRATGKILWQAEAPHERSASKRAGEQGEVTVSVCVDASGRMSDVKLVKSSGFPRWKIIPLMLLQPPSTLPRG